METQMAVSTEVVKTGSEATSSVVEGQKPGGLSHQWSIQAFLDMALTRWLVVEQGKHLVPRTFLPMLRLAAEDPVALDRAHDAILAKNEKVRWLDSPRERWRKYYGNFVRESEWALLEFRKYFSEDEYREMVISTAAAITLKDSQEAIQFMSRMSKDEADAPVAPKGEEKRGFVSRLLENLDPGMFSSFLVGEAEVTEQDEAKGYAKMEIPDCAWHTCASADSLPRPGMLPDQGCQLLCKGVFERVFDGKNSALTMRFDPHLPETSCTLEISW